MVAPTSRGLHRCRRGRSGIDCVRQLPRDLLEVVWRAIRASGRHRWRPGARNRMAPRPRSSPPSACQWRSPLPQQLCVGFEVGDEVLGWTLRAASADRASEKAGLAFEALSVAPLKCRSPVSPRATGLGLGPERCCLRGRSGAMRSQRTRFGRCVPRSRSRRFGSASSGRRG